MFNLFASSLCFIVNTTVTSGMSTDKGEEKRKKKGKKLVKHRDRKRERKGKGMHGEMLPLYTIYNITSLNLRRHKEAMI